MFNVVGMLLHRNMLISAEFVSHIRKIGGHFRDDQTFGPERSGSRQFAINRSLKRGDKNE